MVDVDPFPFATVEELKARWPDMPAGSDDHAATLLEDASQVILDMVPAAAKASPGTRRRFVCAVVRRSMEASLATGSMQATMWAGQVSINQSSAYPHGYLYFTIHDNI